MINWLEIIFRPVSFGQVAAERKAALVNRNANCASRKSRGSIVLIFGMLLSIFMFQGLYSPKAADAVVANLQQFPASPQMTATTGNLSYTPFTISSGSNRLLIVVVSAANNNGSGMTFSATYGGRTLTQAATENSSRRVTWIGYLRETDIASRTGDAVAVTITGTHSGAVGYIASYSGVDQTTPISGSGGYYDNNQTTVAIGPLSVNAGGYGIYNWGGTSGRTRTSDTETYTEHDDGNPTYGALSDYGVASKAIAAAGTTNPTITWSGGARTSVSFVTLNPATIATTVGNGASEPPSVTLAPGTSATMLDAFTLQTNSGNDSVTAVTVTLAPANAFNNIALVEITSDNGATVYGSAANPASNTVAITTAALTATTTSTQYKVRITPKTHANMPAVPGASYATTGTVTAITSTNTKSYNDTTSATVTIDNASPANPTTLSGTVDNAQVALTWTNPADADFSQVVIIRRPNSATDTTQPTEGTTYTLGNAIGTGTVACVINAPTATCTDTGRINGTAYYYRIFAKDTNGNYSQTGTTAGPYTPVATTTVGNGASEPSNVTLSPGASATMLDAFTLQTNTGTDSVTAVTVTLAPANAFNNIALVEIMSDNGATVYGSAANPASNTVAITTAALTATTTSTQYKVRITPKTHANMPAVPGASYATTGTVTAITSTNTKSYNDTASATVTIDNASPANPTVFSGVAGDTQVSLSWTNPADADFSQVVVIRRAGAATGTTQPTEGTTYTLGDAIGTGTVACVVNAPTATCTDTGRTNGTAYYYRIFAKDTNGNYSQTGTTAGPYTPRVSPTVTSTSPNSGAQGATNLNVTINGTGFQSGATSSFSGTGITVNSTTYVDATHLTANISITAGASADARNVTVTNPDGGAGAGSGVFMVTAVPAVTSTAPSNGDTAVAVNSNVTINWSAAVDCSTVNTTNITISSGSWALLSCSDSQAVFYTGSQGNSANYTVAVSTNVKNTSGAAMASPYQFSYRTIGRSALLKQIVQTFYIPIAEEQIRAWEVAISAGSPGPITDTTVNDVISITATMDGTIIYYDQWEDGYEADIANPEQSTTKIWGDGNLSNGAPPGCSSDACDVINAGTVIPLENSVPLLLSGGSYVRDQGSIYFDARDKISATGQLVVSRAGWLTPTGTVLSGAIEVVDTRKWGSSFITPVGTNSANTGTMFNYSALSIMAETDGTVVTVGVNAPVTINEGETIYVSGVTQGTTINATSPIQVNMLTGYPTSYFQGRWFTLLPQSDWTSSYFSPVATVNAAYPASVIFYNPGASAITVNVALRGGTTATVNVPAGGSNNYQMPATPANSGAHFYTSGSPAPTFFAVFTNDFSNASFEFAAMMEPETSLTTSVVVGWSPGYDMNFGAPTPPDVDVVWVTPVANTTIYVNYSGNPNNGSLTDPAGNKYDVAYTLGALQSQRISNPATHIMTGARIYTVDDTNIAAVFGEDPSTGVTGTPGMDLGTSVLPYPSLTAYKSVTLVGDSNSNGGVDPGELLQYTIRVHNSGVVPITTVNLFDTLDTNLTYVANSATIDDNAVTDNISPASRFPFDEGGFNLVPGVKSIIMPGQDIFVVYEATVTSSLPPGTKSVYNNVRVSSVSEIFLNTVTSLVEAGVLQTTKTSSKNGSGVQPGDTITYNVTVTNTSATPQTGIKLNDPLPAGTTYVDHSTAVTGSILKYAVDKFNALSYANNDGPGSWAGNWSESDGGSADPLAGNVQVINGALRLTGNGSWASRAVDLTTGISGRNFTTATLNFDFRTSYAVVAGDTVTVEYYNGGGWSSLGTITGIAGQTIGARSYSIPYLAANSAIRFRISAGYTTATTDFFSVRNVAIKTDEITNVTKDNITGGSYADLANGTLPGLIAQGDGFALAPGETLAVSYRLLVDNPVNETRIVNIVTATSYEKAPLASSTTIDPVSAGGAIGGLVWLDTTVNGFVDYGEPGLSNIRVWLEQNGNGLVYSETLTGTDGKYIFQGLPPGTFTAHVDETTLPPGLTITNNNINPSSSMTLTGYEEFSNVNFGYKNNGSGAVIGNYVWSDANNDGMQDAGEAGLEGVTIQLVRASDSAVIATTTTNAFGIYFFTDVSPDTYIVKADTSNILTGYSPTTGKQSIGSKTSDPIAVAPGDNPMYMDFGFNNPSLFSINDRVWFDQNDSGGVDSGEPGISGITVKLLRGGNVVAVTTSDPNGNFSFPGLPNGSYTIIIEDAAGRLVGFTGTTASAQAGSCSVTISNSSVYRTSFGYNAPGRIGHRVWNDANKNGLYDTGEAGIPNVAVKLYLDTNGDGVFDPSVDQMIDTETTDANGDYMFQVSQTGRFFVSVNYGQTALNGLTLTTTDDQTGTTAPGAQRTVVFLDLNTSYLNANYGFGPIASALAVTKTASPTGTVETGQQITYTITVTNNSATPQSGITIADPLPANTTYVSQSTVAVGPATTKDNVPGGTYTDLTYGDPSSPSNPSHYLVSGDGFTLDQNQSLTVTYAVSVNSPLDQSVSEIVNVASVTSTQSPQPQYTSVTSPVKRVADLSVTKIISQISNPCSEGTCSVTYTLTVTNVGETDISSASITDLLPSQLSWRSDTGSGAYNKQTGAWTISNIAKNGGSASLDITATVIGSGLVQNCAVLTSSLPSDTYAANDQSCASFVPTYVTLSGFRVFVEGGTVVVEWETASERNTVGFHIERYNDKTREYVRVNRRLLPGLITSHTGGTYRLIDEAAPASGKYLYRLVEVESRGNRVIYGPFSVDLGGPAELKTEKTVGPDGTINLRIRGKVAASSRSSELSLEGFERITGTFGRKARKSLSAKVNRLGALRMAQVDAVQSGTPKTGTAIRMSVSEDGIYYIDSADISGMLNIPRTSVKDMIGKRLFALTSGGKQISYTPAEDYAGFFFYGNAVDSIYTNKNIYWLENGDGALMQTVDGDVKGAKETVSPELFTDTLHLEQDVYDAPTLTSDPNADYWFWDYVMAGYPPFDSKEFSFQVNSVSAAPGNASIIVRLQSIASERSHALISLNGINIAEGVWDGLSPHTIVANIDQGLLIEGENLLGVKALLDSDVPFSMFFIDSFDAKYSRRFEAVNDLLSFSSAEPSILSIEGFSHPDISVFEISDRLRPKLVTSTEVSGDTGNYSVKFYSRNGNASYVAFAAGADRAVDAVADLSSDLKNKVNAADYIVIAPKELEDAAALLADYRKSKGLKVKVALLEDIMDEFNFGIYDPNAIRTFLHYAYDNWNTRPRYAVLVGSGTYDYKNLAGYGGNLIPALMVGSPWGLSPSDNVLGDFDGDNVPEVIIGRLPVLSTIELQTVLDKIKAFEGTSLEGTMLLADKPDGGGDFPKDSNDIVGLFAPDYPLQKIYLQDYQLDEARQALFDGMNQGTKYINYIGHGAVDRFSEEGLLTRDDAATLTNTVYPVLTALTCSSGNYALGGWESLMAALIAGSKGGIVSSWAPSDWSYNADANILGEGFYQAVFQPEVTTLGDAVKKSMNAYKAAGRASYELNIFNILGDPALRLK